MASFSNTYQCEIEVIICFLRRALLASRAWISSSLAIRISFNSPSRLFCSQIIFSDQSTTLCSFERQVTLVLSSSSSDIFETQCLSICCCKVSMVSDRLLLRSARPSSLPLAISRSIRPFSLRIAIIWLDFSRESFNPDNYYSNSFLPYSQMLWLEEMKLSNVL